MSCDDHTFDMKHIYSDHNGLILISSDHNDMMWISCDHTDIVLMKSYHNVDGNKL